MKFKAHKKRWLALLALVIVAAAALMITPQQPGGYATFTAQQAAGHRQLGPPPWPEGNGFWVKTRWMIRRERVSSWVRQHLRWAEHLPWIDKLMSPAYSQGWFVANMHAENFNAFCQQQGIKWVKVERFVENGCLVVDERVPREWLLSYPAGGFFNPSSVRLLLDHPEFFHPDDWVQSLVGTRWELIERAGRDHWLEQLLPGERVAFEDVRLFAGSRTDPRVATRIWRASGQGTAGFLTICDLKDDGTWTAIQGSLEVAGDSLVFTLQGSGSSSNDSSSWSFHDLEGPLARATYRRLPAEEQASAP